MSNLYIALLHYPVKNQHGQIINTSITNLDVHDLARLAETYVLQGFYIIQPLSRQKKLFTELIDFWRTGIGAAYNPLRAKAFEKIYLRASLEDCLLELQEEDPLVIATGANITYDMDFASLRRLKDQRNVLILFGTGWGLGEEVLQKAHYRLRPIEGVTTYNHLSVRSAASIIMDRICGKKWW